MEKIWNFIYSEVSIILSKKLISKQEAYLTDVVIGMGGVLYQVTLTCRWLEYIM